MKFFFSLVLLLAVFTLPACISKPPEFTPMQLRLIQSRTFQIEPIEVFYGSKTVLQDNSYLIRDSKRDPGFVYAEKLITLADPSQRGHDPTPSCSRLRSMDSQNHTRDLFRKVKGKSRKVVREASSAKERKELVRECKHEKRFPKPPPEYDVLRTDRISVGLEGQTTIRLGIEREIMTNKGRVRSYKLTKPRYYNFLLNQILVELERRKIRLP